MKPWSLRGRLTRRVLAALAGAWALSLGLGIYTVGHEMNELVDEDLRTQAHLILALERAHGRIPDMSPELMIRIYHGDTPTFSTTDIPWPAVQGDGRHDTADWRVWRLTDPQDGISVEIGQSSALRRDELYESLRTFVFLMIFVLAIGGTTVWFGTRNALRPARQFAELMGRRQATDLTPLTDTGLPAELVPIPQSLNGYLSRIEALIESERRFAADAAHELRTPVAIALAQAQLMTPLTTSQEEIDKLSSALNRLSHLVARLLQLSRAETDLAHHTEQAELIDICRLLISDRPACAVAFDDRDRDRADVAVDPDSLAILLANLIDNACDHGTGDVRVTLLAPDQLEISNRAGPDAAFRQDRFGRSAASSGSGLGLSIVATIAALYGVTLDFEMSGGRAVVRLHFPRPSEGPGDDTQQAPEA